MTEKRKETNAEKINSFARERVIGNFQLFTGEEKERQREREIESMQSGVRSLSGDDSRRDLSRSRLTSIAVRP